MEELIINDKNKVKLDKPIVISDLLNGMSEFTIAANEDEPAEDVDIFDEDNEEFDQSRNIVADPKLQLPFAEQKLDMFQIGNGIFKLILTEGTGRTVTDNALITMDYSSFWELAEYPYDNTWINSRPLTQKLGEDMLPGLYHSLLSMREGEVAKFIVPYRLLYGALGCEEAGIPRAADGLYLIRVISFKDVGDSGAITEDFIDEYNSYEKVLERVAEVRKSAKENFAAKEYEKAVKDYKKCITALKFSHSANEKERQEILDQMYVNLCICYNKLERHANVLKLKDDLAHCLFTNCKAIFQMARAHFKNGDYDDAIRYLGRAQKLQPNNGEIAAELKAANEANVAYKKDMKEISQKALRNRGSKQEQTIDYQDNPMYQLLEMHVNNFINDGTKTKHILPVNLGEEELKMVQQIAKNKNLLLEQEKSDNSGSREENSYYLSKQ